MQNDEGSLPKDSISIEEIVLLSDLQQWLGDVLDDEDSSEVSAVVNQIYHSLAEPVETLNDHLYMGHDKNSDSIKFHIEVIRMAAKQAVEMLKLSGSYAYSHCPWYEYLCIGIPDVVQSGDVFMWKIFKAAHNLSKSPAMSSLALNIKTLEDAGGEFAADFQRKGGATMAEQKKQRVEFIRYLYQRDCATAKPSQKYGGFSSKTAWAEGKGRKALLKAGFDRAATKKIVEYLKGL